MANKMKLLFLMLLMPSIFLGQNPIPNPGFEDWSGGEPVNWVSNNIPNSVIMITQTSTAHSGASAVKCETGNLANNPWPASLSAGTASDQFIPVSQNYAVLSGYYQLHTTGSDYIGVAAYLYNASKTGIVASISASLDTPVDTYTHFSLEFDYSSGTTDDDAAFMLLQFLTSMGVATEIGSYFLLDDLEVSGITAIEPHNKAVPASFDLSQNYPNPFNPSTNIEFSIPKSVKVSLDIFNTAGQHVAAVINKHMEKGQHSVTWNAGNLPGGVYIYRLKTGKLVQSKKLILLK